MDLPPALARARQDLAAAAARLRRLKRTAAEPASEPARLQAWRALRLELDALEQLLTAFSPSPSEEPLSEELAARKSELERRGARAEERLERADALRAQADGFREEALAELDRVRRGWALLRAEARAEGVSPSETDLAAVLARLQAALAAGERALEEERRALEEGGAASRTWGRLVEVFFPEFEDKARSGDSLLMLPTLRRLLEDLDERWREGRAALRRGLGLDPGDVVSAERSQAEKARALASGDEGELRLLRERLAFERERADAYRAALRVAARQMRALREKLSGHGPETG